MNAASFTPAEDAGAKLANDTLYALFAPGANKRSVLIEALLELEKLPNAEAATYGFDSIMFAAMSLKGEFKHV